MSFASSFQREVDTAQRRLDKTRRSIILSLFSSVIRDTPVKEGRLRGNWQTSVGAPKTDTLGARSAQESISEVDRATLSLKGDDIVFLRNNLPYARVVEFGEYPTANAGKPKSKVTSEGFSRKAPSGMLRRNVERVKTLILAEISKGRTA